MCHRRSVRDIARRKHSRDVTVLEAQPSVLLSAIERLTARCRNAKGRKPSRDTCSTLHIGAAGIRGNQRHTGIESIGRKCNRKRNRTLHHTRTEAGDKEGKEAHKATRPLSIRNRVAVRCSSSRVLLIIIIILIINHLIHINHGYYS